MTMTTAPAAPFPAPRASTPGAPAAAGTPETDLCLAHDRAWAALGCRVVRPGRIVSLRPAAEGLYLLLGPDELAALPLAPVREAMNWLRPDLLVVRLRRHAPGGGARGTAEALVPKAPGLPAMGLGVSTQTSEDGVTSDNHSGRPMFTTDPVLARQWRRSDGGPVARRAIRRAVPDHRRWTCNLPRGTSYHATNPADAAAYAANPRRPAAHATLPPSGPVRPNRWLRRAWRPLKRASDVLGAALALAVVLPITPLALLAAWVCVGRPLFDRQRCRTRGGRTFTCWSLRLPTPEQAGPFARLTRQALTAIGADRWPQLVHVLRGEMALVGPPPTAETPPARLAPGLIGLSQLMQRRRRAWSDAARRAYDRSYARQASPGLDLKIFIAALMVRGRGESS